MQKVIALLGVLLLTGGCASVATLPSTFSSLNPSSASLEIHNQTEVKLTEGNFVVVKTNVVGYAHGFSLLGFITVSPARFETAMGRLYSKAEMESGKSQTLGNLIVEKTSAYWVLFSIPRVSVRADVLEFTPGHAAILIPHPPPRDKDAPPMDGRLNGTPSSEGRQNL